MVITCTRRIQFCAGHRVVNHESKCANFHGHNWIALITAQADALDEVGRVVDFSVIKERYGEWIDTNWDHGMILFDADPHVAIFETALKTKLSVTPFNPTSENLATCLLKLGPSLMPPEIRITKVVLFETENCSSEASL